MQKMSLPAAFEGEEGWTDGLIYVKAEHFYCPSREFSPPLAFFCSRSLRRLPEVDGRTGD